jgi:CheY-like chemotaxis protein
MAPWLDAPDVTTVASKRGLGRAARAETETSLEKLRVLVADDDAAVCWFLAGVLKTAGATVYEARDGERALEIAKHVNPDLIISDILMPRMDGFNLSRIVRRDVVLRDVPIVLLSWKEDLLQRVRELGADADGYLRKEASAGAIVQRAKELVRQRRRVAQRIATQGEVRGRLDGLTTHTLLRLVCQLRESSTVSVRDASYLYEVEIRGGKPIRATRTALDGSFERGAGVLAALLGAGDGRFSVSPPREDGDVGPVRHELSGSLTDQVMPVVASARAAQRLLSGANLMRVQRVEVDDEAIQSYLAATPHAARTIVETVARGACPRDLVTNGAASARLLEDVLIDAAVHGGIIQILDASGEDRLPGATALELAILRGERTVSPIASLPVLGVGADAQGPLEPAPWSDRLREVIAQPSQEAPRGLRGPACAVGHRRGRQPGPVLAFGPAAAGRTGAGRADRCRRRALPQRRASGRRATSDARPGCVRAERRRGPVGRAACGRRGLFPRGRPSRRFTRSRRRARGCSPRHRRPASSRRAS